MKAKKTKGIPCSNMNEFDAVMEGSNERSDVERGTREHTPGPWHTWTGKDGKHTVVSHGKGSIEVGNEADARLIAAAPELLEASKKLIAYMEQVGYQDDEGTGLDMRLREAIAKAEGK